jgi:hypothetical protein
MKKYLMLALPEWACNFAHGQGISAMPAANPDGPVATVEAAPTYLLKIC